MQNEISTEWPNDSEYGVCRLSIINLYQQPRLGTGLITQMLFGETYRVLERSSCLKWLKVVGSDDMGEGWMLLLQHQAISKEEFIQFNDNDYQVTSSPISTIFFKGQLLHLLPGSNIHISQNELFDIGESIKFKGKCRPHALKASRDEICAIALSFLNVPAQFGGRSYFGIGAGAFVHLVFKIGGYNSPRFLSQIVESGNKVFSYNSQPGDILIFANDKQIHDHVGIYLGDGEMIHVNGKVTKNEVNLDGAKTDKNISPYWHVHEIRNII
jgi:gamma-D-glutamyl-L-lysine dipeptidyl-peptidase